MASLIAEILSGLILFPFKEAITKKRKLRGESEKKVSV